MVRTAITMLTIRAFPSSTQKIPLFEQQDRTAGGSLSEHAADAHWNYT
jgi:hypothetical protein